MNKKEIEIFKDELKYYLWLKDMVKRLEDKLEDLLYQMGGVKGISYDKVPVNMNEQNKNENKLDLIEKYNKIENELNKYKKRLDYIDGVLGAMNIYDRKMFLLKYEEGLSFQQIANQYYISKAGLFYRMQRVLEKI